MTNPTIEKIMVGAQYGFIPSKDGFVTVIPAGDGTQALGRRKIATQQIEALITAQVRAARIEENEVFMARLGRYSETGGVKVEVLDCITELKKGER